VKCKLLNDIVDTSSALPSAMPVAQRSSSSNREASARSQTWSAEVPSDSRRDNGLMTLPWLSGSPAADWRPVRP